MKDIEAEAVQASLKDGSMDRALRVQELPVAWHGLTGVATQRMTQDETNYMIKLIGVEAKAAEKGLEMHEEMLGFPLYAILHNRLEAVGASDKISVPLMAFCSIISKNPVDTVMWAYTLNYMLVASKAEKLTFEQFCNWFPWGLPIETVKHDAWCAQKGYRMKEKGIIEANSRVDNWVDNFSNWPR